MLDAIEPGSLPVAGSRLNDGIDRAVALFPAGAAKHRAIVLLSDGEFHGEALPPIIERLKSEHIVVHTVGVGTRAGAPLPLPGGAENEFKRDDAGQVVVSRLSPATLQELAKATGGEYVAADRSIVELAPILTALRSMEGRTIDSEDVSSAEERFQWPLAVAAIALVGLLAVSPLRAA